MIKDAKSAKRNITYILRCADGTLYTGWTNNLEKRIRSHNAGTGSKYTRSRRPVQVVFTQFFDTKEAAMKREAEIKQLSRNEKMLLIAAFQNQKETEGKNMIVRHAKPEDLPDILRIYAHARSEMKKNGNPNQWGDEWPPEDIVSSDIPNQIGYVVEENGHIGGVFAFISGIDPTYIQIENGAWLNDEPYGTIHRIASDGTIPGILHAAVKYCADKTDNIRIDTHTDNKIMLHLLEKEGFSYCGVIYVRNHESRVAFQKVLKK